MKAVLLAPEFAAHDGGIQRILRLYLRALAGDPAHSSLALVALNDRPADLAHLGAQIEGKSLQVLACAGSRATFLRAAWRAGANAGRIVCGHVGQLPVAALVKRRGTGLACVAHGVEAWPRLGFIQRLALRRLDRMFCVSRYTRDRLAVNHLRLTSRLRVVPNALDPAFLADTPVAPPPAGAPIILCVGRLCQADAYKGYDLLIRAFAQLDHTGADDPCLRFVGDGDDRARLTSLAENLGVAARIEFTGRLDDDALRTAFRQCHCFALPSTGEGFGLVYLEAMAAGRPCVGVRAAAVPELITAGTGCLAEPNDPTSLTSALRSCLRTNWDAAKIRAHANDYSLANLTARLKLAWA